MSCETSSLSFTFALICAAVTVSFGSCVKVIGDPHGGSSLLEQEKSKLHALKLDAGSYEIREQGSPSRRLLDRVFDSSTGERLGFDASLIEVAFEKHQAPLRHEEAKALLHSMSSGRRHDPVGMATFVQESLLDLSISTTRSLQVEIDMALEAVTNCSDLLWDAEKALAHREKILERDESEEYQCLIAENTENHKARDACEEVNNKIATVALAEPKKIKELENTSAEFVLDAMKKSMDWFNDETPILEELVRKCQSAKEKAAATHENCIADDQVVNKFFCYMKAARDQACAEYDKRFTEAFKHFQHIKTEVEKPEKINKDHFTFLACSSWVDGSIPCENNIADTTHLDVSYPEEPVQASCIEIMKTNRNKNLTCRNTGNATDELSDHTPEPTVSTTEDEDDSDPKIKVTIEGVDYNQLMGDSSVSTAVEKALKTAVLNEIENTQGKYEVDMNVQFLEGSVIAIITFSGPSAGLIETTKLALSTNLQEDIARGLSYVEGIADVLSGTIRVNIKDLSQTVQQDIGVVMDCDTCSDLSQCPYCNVTDVR